MIFLLLFFFLFGCNQTGEPAMEYSINQCNASDGIGSGFSMVSSGDTVRIHQDQSYVCCANMTLSMETEGKTMMIYEDNVGEMCKCICPFEADITLKNTAGFERVEVYGIRFKDVQDYELMFNSSLAG